MNLFQALILSVVEGFTEFLPISSTGHLILVGDLLKIIQTDFVKTFEISIQLGAILAVVYLYWKKLTINIELWKKIIAAFIPSAVVGFIFYSFIKDILIGNSTVVLVSLFLGGLALILLEKLHKEKTNDQKFESISYKNALIIGPDVESYKWAEKTAEIIGCESAILKKDRISARKVKVSFNKRIDTKKSKALFVSSKIPKEFFLDIKNKNIVIVDDIISTGHTLLETIKLLKKTGAKKITCICVHGIFAENGLKKLRRTGAKIISCNTIPNPVAKIDVSEIIAKAI